MMASVKSLFHRLQSLCGHKLQNTVNLIKHWAAHNFGHMVIALHTVISLPHNYLAHGYLNDSSHIIIIKRLEIAILPTQQIYGLAKIHK